MIIVKHCFNCFVWIPIPYKTLLPIAGFQCLYMFASMQSTKRFQHDDDDNIGKKMGNIKETTENKRSQFVILFFS